MPILNIYCTHFISALRIGEFLGIILVMCLLLGRFKIKITNKFYWIAILYLILISLSLTAIIISYSFLGTIVRIFRVLFYTFLGFALAPLYWEQEYGKKVYVNLVSIASGIVLLQFIILQMTNRFIPFVLPEMNLSTNYATSNDFLLAMEQDFILYGKSIRVSGLFLEPAHFCEFTVFSIVFLLFEENNKKIDYVKIGIITAAIILSGSAIGFFSLSIIYILWVAFTVKSGNISIKNFFLIIVIILSGCIATYQFDLLKKALWRILTVKDSSASTGNLRLLRGFIVYKKMPMLFQIIGMGIGNYSAFITTYDITTFFDATLNRTNEFMNSISIILVSGGIIGFTLYLFALVKFFWCADKIQKILYLIFIIILVTSNNFYKETYMMMLIFISYSEQRKKILYECND